MLFLATGVPHVIVDKVPHAIIDRVPTVFINQDISWTEKGMFAATVALAIVTALLFNATRQMAGETKRLAQKTADMATETANLARDTVDASNRADEHHQQTLWPFVAVTRFLELGQAGVKLEVMNIGGTFSSHVSAMVVEVGGKGQGDKPFGAQQLGPLGPGSTEILDIQYFNDGSRFPENSHRTFTVQVNYATMFGTIGFSRWKWEIGKKIRCVTISLPSIAARDKQARAFAIVEAEKTAT